MNLSYVSIGNCIREMRILRGCNQSNLAEQLGIAPSNISHIEHVTTEISLPALVNIANSLDEIVYDSLIQNTHISIGIINGLLSD